MVSLVFFDCSRDDEDADVLSQEDISNIILKVKDDITGVTAVYDYAVNSVDLPSIKLTDGHTYSVETVFLNGNEDETESIKKAKDEHFLLYSFQNAQVTLTRKDDPAGTRTDGNRLGLLTNWTVIKTQNGAEPQLTLTLIHDAAAVSEAAENGVFGKTDGGETDAIGTFRLQN